MEYGAVVFAEHKVFFVLAADNLAADAFKFARAADMVVMTVGEQGIFGGQSSFSALGKNARLTGVDNDAGRIVGRDDIAVCRKPDGVYFINFHICNASV